MANEIVSFLTIHIKHSIAPLLNRHTPVQTPVKAQVSPALVQTGKVGVPENPELQVTDVQLPTTAVVAVPTQWYPVGAMHASAERCDGAMQGFNGVAPAGRQDRQGDVCNS